MRKELTRMIAIVACGLALIGCVGQVVDYDEKLDPTALPMTTVEWTASATVKNSTDPVVSEIPVATETVTATATNRPSETATATEKVAKTAIATTKVTKEAIVVKTSIEEGSVIERPCFDIDELFVNANGTEQDVRVFADKTKKLNAKFDVLSVDDFKAKVEATVAGMGGGSGEFIDMRIVDSVDDIGMRIFEMDDRGFVGMTVDKFAELKMINIVEYTKNKKGLGGYFFVFTYQDANGKIINMGFEEASFSTKQVFGTTTYNREFKPWSFFGVIDVIDYDKAIKNGFYPYASDYINSDSVTTETIQAGELGSEILVVRRRSNN